MARVARKDVGAGRIDDVTVPVRPPGSQADCSMDGIVNLTSPKGLLGLIFGSASSVQWWLDLADTALALNPSLMSRRPRHAHGIPGSDRSDRATSDTKGRVTSPAGTKVA